MDPDLVSRIIETASAIQQIPAPTFGERERAAHVLQLWQAEGAAARLDAAGNVVARLPGRGLRPPVVVSAHLDTVFPSATDLTLRRSQDRLHGPGIGDNSLGVAGLFALLWQVSRGGWTPPGDLILAANVGEEGLGDLSGMRQLVADLGATVQAYLILEGMALGQIYHRGLGVQRYRITVTTPGGHSWVDYGEPSAIHELAHLVTRLTAIPMTRQPRTTLNVGMIQGGVSINTIAPQAALELDLRAETAPALARLVTAVEEIVARARRDDLTLHAEVIGQRPSGAIPPDHPLVHLAERSLAAQGITPSLGIGSTDANIPLSRGLAAVCIGLSRGGGAHTTNEWIHLAPLEKGLAQLLAVTQGAFQLTGS